MKLEKLQSYESKTISTSPSLQQIPTLPVHNYHQYDSLLRYITSFITDFKLNILELKELVFSLVGVNLNANRGETMSSDNNCQQCQVEYMMLSCRKAREDMVKILAIMRGYVKVILAGSNYLLENEKRKYSKLNQSKDHSQEKLKVNFSFGSIADEEKSRKNFQLGGNNIGFLTFRENMIEDKSQNKRYSSHIIQQENIQTSRSMPQYSCRLRQMNSIGQDRKLYGKFEFSRVFELINLIRLQINQPQYKSRTSANQEIQLRQEQTERTATVMGDSPIARRYCQQVS